MRLSSIRQKKYVLLFNGTTLGWQKLNIIQDALKALVGLHDRLVRGRKLVVTFAHQVRQTHGIRNAFIHRAT
jgi:hypothetical protein